MRMSKFTPEQILQALRQAEAGTVVGDNRRKLGVTEATFYRWKKTYAGMDVGQLRELRQLREENRRLKGVVADLTLTVCGQHKGIVTRFLRAPTEHAAARAITDSASNAERETTMYAPGLATVNEPRYRPLLTR